MQDNNTTVFIVDADLSPAERKFRQAQDGAERAARAIGQRIIEVYEKSVGVITRTLSAISAGILAAASVTVKGFGSAAAAVRDFALAHTEAALLIGRSTVAIRQQASAAETLINVYRAVRLALSPTLFTGATLAIGALVVETLKLVNARGKVIEQQALYSAANQVSFSAVQRADAVVGIGGGNARNITSLSAALSSRIDSNQGNVRGGLDALGISRNEGRQFDALSPQLLAKIAEGFASIEDPAKRASAAAALFGRENAATALQELTPAFASASAAVDKYGLVLDSVSKNQIYAFHRDLANMKAALTDFSDVKGWWQSFKDGAEIVAAAAYDMAKRARNSFREMIENAVPVGAALRILNGERLPVLDATAEKERRASIDRGLVADDLIAQANVARARQDSTPNGQRSLAAAARTQSESVYQKIVDDAKARALNPKDPNLLSNDERFSLATQLQSYSQRAAILDRHADDMRAAEDAKLAARGSNRATNDAYQNILEDDRIKKLKEASVGPLSESDFKSVLQTAFDKITRDINSQIEAQRKQIDPKTGAVIDVSDTDAFKLAAARLQGSKTGLVRNEFTRLTLEQQDTDSAYYRERLNQRIIKDQDLAAAKKTAQLNLDNSLLDQSNKAADRQYAIDASQVGRDRSLALQGLGETPAQTIQQKIALEDAKLAIERTYAAKSLTIELEKLKAAKAFEIESLTDIARGAGLKTDGISAAVSENFDQQIQAAQKAAADQDLILARETQNEKTKIAVESNRTIFESLKRSSEGLFDALISRTQSFGDALKATLKAAILTPIKDILSSQTAALLTRLLTGKTVSFSEIGNGQGTLGKIGGVLGRAGLGQPNIEDSKLALSTNTNSVVTDANSRAVVDLTSLLRQMIGGSSSSISPSRNSYGFPGGFGAAARMGAWASTLTGIARAGGFGGGASAGDGDFAGISGTINYDGGGSESFSSLQRLIGGPGGTSGFSGPIGGLGGVGGGAGAGASPSSGIGGALSKLSGLKDMFYNSGWFVKSPGVATTASGIGGIGGTLAGFAASPAGGLLGASLLLGGLSQKSSVSADAQTGVGGGLLGANIGSMLPALGLTGGALLGGGLGLGAAGLKRGGLGGLFETVGGGALTGAALGTTIFPGIGTAVGAAAGAAIGAIAGLIRLAVPSSRQHIIDLVKTTYNIKISNQIADQIGQIAKQSFAGQASIAIRSTQVQELLSLYADSTGQKFPIRVAPRPFEGAITNGQLYQASTSLNGKSVGFSSALPTLPGYGISNYLPVGYGNGLGTPNNGPTVVQASFNINGRDVASVFNGQQTTFMSSSQGSRVVAGANNRAQSQNAGRLQNQGNILDPTVVYG